MLVRFTSTAGRPAMGCRPRERAAMFMAALLFLLASCQGLRTATVASAKHQTRVNNVRKLVSTSRSAGGGGSRGAAAVRTTTTAATACAAGCSEEVVRVSQDSAGQLPGGVPSYYVTITNTCLVCTVRDVRVSCGEFATTELVQPAEFRRAPPGGDCLVRDGGPIAPGETVSFHYSNAFPYSLDVVSVCCDGRT